MNLWRVVMNIFVLDTSPVSSAQMQCDKHVVKMILETAQLLCSPFEPDSAPYRRTHFNHPCSKWVRESKANYLWLVQHGIALCSEYEFRYGKKHKSSAVIKWCLDNINSLNFPEGQLTAFPKAMPDQYKTNDVVESYRNYYLGDKKKFAKWTRRGPPNWWKR